MPSPGDCRHSAAPVEKSFECPSIGFVQGSMHRGLVSEAQALPSEPSSRLPRFTGATGVVARSKGLTKAIQTSSPLQHWSESHTARSARAYASAASRTHRGFTIPNQSPIATNEITSGAKLKIETPSPLTFDA